MRLPQTTSPWIVAMVDAGAFVALWVGVGVAVSGWAAWNGLAAVIALLLGASIVFWWGFHSMPWFSEGRASLRWAVLQGLAWSCFLSTVLWFCTVLFATTVGLRDLGRSYVVSELARSFLSVVGVCSAVGMFSGLGLGLLNLRLVRPNPSIERTVSSGLRPLPTAAHVKR